MLKLNLSEEGCPFIMLKKDCIISSDRISIPSLSFYLASVRIYNTYDRGIALPNIRSGTHRFRGFLPILRIPIHALARALPAFHNGVAPAFPVLLKTAGNLLQKAQL